MFLFTPDSEGLYRPINVSLLLRRGKRSEQLGLLIVWSLTCIVCVYLGWASVAYDWYKIQVSLGVSEFTFTLYPPLSICLLWVMLFGYWWGAIPAFLATLTLALYADMPVGRALLFAFSNPLGFAVYSIVYRAFPIQASLRKPGSILFFILIGLFSAILSSAGSFLWSHTYKLDTFQLFSIWQGWWFGGFIQQVFIVGPVLFAVFHTVEKLKENKVWAPAIVQMDKRHIFLLSGIVVSCALLFIFFTLKWNQDLYTNSIEGGDFEGMQSAYYITLQSLQAVYWIMGAMLVFMVALSVQFFILRTNTLSEAKEEAETQARTDYLTGLYNRRAFFDLAKKIEKQAKRYDRPYAISLMDIDHFKSVNDKWGHNVGDEALKVLSKVIADGTRGEDIVARFGGEEFIFMMPETDPEMALITAERIRKSVEDKVLKSKDGKTIKLSISGGVAGQSSIEEEIEDVIYKADMALYKAKEGGRNRVER